MGLLQFIEIIMWQLYKERGWIKVADTIKKYKFFTRKGREKEWDGKLKDEQRMEPGDLLEMMEHRDRIDKWVHCAVHVICQHYRGDNFVST